MLTMAQSSSSQSRHVSLMHTSFMNGQYLSFFILTPTGQKNTPSSAAQMQSVGPDCVVAEDGRFLQGKIDG